VQLDREAEVGLADLGLFWRKKKWKEVEVEVQRVSELTT